MNLCESVVLEVILLPRQLGKTQAGIIPPRLGESYQKFGYWFRDVKYNSYGVTSCTSILCKSKEEADKISIGYKFDC